MKINYEKAEHVLRQAMLFFEHRDRMNAAVHMDSVRESTLTIAVRDLYRDLVYREE